MNMDIFLRSTTDWSMDNVWSAILDQLKVKRPDLWNQLYTLVRTNGTLTRATIAGIMQAAGWAKDILPFLPPNLKALGDDMLAQSAGSITNYFLRQPAPAEQLQPMTAEVLEEKVSLLTPDFRKFLQEFSYNDERQHPSRDAHDLISRIRVIYQQCNGDLTTADEALLESVSNWIGSLPARQLKGVQIAVEDAEYIKRCLDWVTDGTLPADKQEYYQNIWKNGNFFERTRLGDLMALPLEKRNKIITLSMDMLEGVFHKISQM